MNKDMQELYCMFSNIKEMGFVPSKRKGSTGVGYTFECLINKKEDSNPCPDYKSIEIKTLRYHSKQKIHLFSASPDGDCEFPIKNVLNKLGYKRNGIKRCYISVYGNKSIQLGYYKMVKLDINRRKEKIYLKAIDAFGQDMELNTSWSFAKLKEKVENKINSMAVIKVQNKFKNDKEFFYYSKIAFYKIKGFNTFVDLLEKGIIKVTIKVNETLDKHLENHGVDFSIEIKDIEMLFDKIKN